MIEAAAGCWNGGVLVEDTRFGGLQIAVEIQVDQTRTCYEATAYQTGSEAVGHRDVNYLPHLVGRRGRIAQLHPARFEPYQDGNRWPHPSSNRVRDNLINQYLLDAADSNTSVCYGRIRMQATQRLPKLDHILDEMTMGVFVNAVFIWIQSIRRVFYGRFTDRRVSRETERDTARQC